jgi:acyl-CoA reductase-like NAD-dependent aldehyde dehydrogenase
MPSTTAPETLPAAPSAERDERLDGFVALARAAADEFRAIEDQETVDRIVRALVIAGLENAVDLARIVTEETGFGVSRTRSSRTTSPPSSSTTTSRTSARSG